jgi:MFS family permease
MSQTVLGALMVALSFTAYFLGKFKALSAFFVFVGIILVGTGSTVSTIIGRVLTSVQSFAGTATAAVFGVSSAVILSGVLLFVLIHDLAPRNSAKKRTFWIAVVLGVLVATGTTGSAALNHLDTTVKNGTSTVQGH